MEHFRYLHAIKKIKKSEQARNEANINSSQQRFFHFYLIVYRKQFSLINRYLRMNRLFLHVSNNFFVQMINWGGINVRF